MKILLIVLFFGVFTLYGCFSPKPLTQEQMMQISQSLLQNGAKDENSAIKTESKVEQKISTITQNKEPQKIVSSSEQKIVEQPEKKSFSEKFFKFVDQNISWLTFVLYILCQWVYWLYRYKVGKKSETFEQIIELLGKKLSWTKKTMFYFLKRWFLNKQEEKENKEEGEKK